jgi:hypothetical protein
MIKSLLALLLVFSLHLEIFSQKNVLKLDLFGTFVTSITTKMPMPRLSYERTFKDKFSWQLAMECGKYDRIESGSMSYQTAEVYNVTGWGIMPEFRYYPFTQNKTAPMGWFVSTHYRYFSLLEHYFEGPFNIKTKGNVNNFGLNIGFKHGNNIVVGEYLLGLGLSSGKWNDSNDRAQIPSTIDVEDLRNFATFRFEINLGIRFPQAF